MQTTNSRIVYVVTGWLLAFVILLTMVAMDILRSILANDGFAALKRDPGVWGMPMLVGFFFIYAVMPLYVYVADALRWRILKWIAVGVTGLMLMWSVMHHLTHILHGERSSLSSNLLDSVEHLALVWVLITTFQWSRAPKSAERVAAGVGVPVAEMAK